MLREAVGRMDEALHLHDALDAIEVAEERLRLRQHVQGAEARAGARVFERHLAAHLADVAKLSIPAGDLPGNEEQRSRQHAGHEIRHRCNGLGQIHLQLAQTRFDPGCHDVL